MEEEAMEEVEEEVERRWCYLQLHVFHSAMGAESGLT